MAYLEELLPEFRKGAKIRKNYWDKHQYIYYEDNNIYTHKNMCINLIGDELVAGYWELYKEPEPDWDYIIGHKCLCEFWDDREEENKHIGILKEFKKDGKYKFSIVTPDNYVNDISFTNCRPARKDELTFYEDKKDEI